MLLPIELGSTNLERINTATRLLLVADDKSLKTRTTLLNVIENILKNPDNVKFQRLKCSNKTVKGHLIKPIGARLFLKGIGFSKQEIEDEEFYVFDCAQMQNLKLARQWLEILSDSIPQMQLHTLKLRLRSGEHLKMVFRADEPISAVHYFVKRMTGEQRPFYLFFYSGQQSLSDPQEKFTDLDDNVTVETAELNRKTLLIGYEGDLGENSLKKGGDEYEMMEEQRKRTKDAEIKKKKEKKEIEKLRDLTIKGFQADRDKMKGIQVNPLPVNTEINQLNGEPLALKDEHVE